MKRLRSPLSLRTGEAERQYLEALLQPMPHTGELFRPPAQWYSLPLSTGELDNIAKQLCQWLGIKPRHLSVSFSIETGTAAGRYLEDKNGHHILIHPRYSALPYETLAIVAHELTHYLVESRWQIPFDNELDREAFIDTASIQLGLGVLIINGLDHREGWFQQLLGRLRPGHYRLQLGSLSPEEYSYRLGHFVADSQKLNSSTLAAELAPWSRRLFKTPLPDYTKLALHVQQAQKRIQRTNLSLAGACIAVLMLAGLAAYILQQLPRSASPAVIEQKEKVDQLYQSYTLCQQTVASSQAAMTQADILQQETLAANTQRCTSLRNQYNAAVTSYNQALAK